MHNDLDGMLAKLRAAPLDRRLDDLPGDVGRRIAGRSEAAQTWGFRAVAAALVTLAGVVISAPTTAATAKEASSPFAMWSSLAPSTLLGPLG